MLAIKYLGPHVPFALESVAIPDVGEDDVQIHIRSASLCYTENHFLDGTLDLGISNIIMGHEAAGVIIRTGSRVESSRIGERVVLYYYSGCQSCKHCLYGNEQICDALIAEYGFITNGTLAKYIVVPSRNAVRLPDSIVDFDIAAPIGCGATTAVHASKIADIRAGEWIAVYGVNAVGFNLLQLCKHFGSKVIAIGRSKEKLSKAIELGADVVINAEETSNVNTEIRRVTNGSGADVIFECVGSRESLDNCLGFGGGLGKRGRLIIIGYQKGAQHDIRVHPIPLLVYEQRICGSVGATLEDLREAIQYVADEILQIVIDSKISISEVPLALEKMRSFSSVGKIVVNNFDG